MDKKRQKSKKDKPQKYVEKEKNPGTLITDVKTIKENLKIKEILRTVKMNSSMRIKAPRGSRVMHNKDFNEHEEGLEEVHTDERTTIQPTSATNLNVVVDTCIDASDEPAEDNCDSVRERDNEVDSSTKSNLDIISDPPITIHRSNSFSDCSPISLQAEPDYLQRTPDIEITPVSEYTPAKPRDRKLSLDQTMLTRREGLSQSELDLHSIGKSPLERKSSFFRKKMDSFLKNTTEIFKRQSLTRSPSFHRRGSMSVSLQSLNENTCNGAEDTQDNAEVQSSVTSLLSSTATMGRSNSSLSTSQGERLAQDTGEEDSSLGSQPALNASQPLDAISSSSIHSLNAVYEPESLLNARAISMSSGLDTAHGRRRRKSARSNRRQEETNKDVPVSYSYQEVPTRTENNRAGTNLDSKGRRLSYQRAVSGEDPVPSPRFQDTLRRKGTKHSEVSSELTTKLSDFSKNGVPGLQSFAIYNMSEEAIEYLAWVETPSKLECYDVIAYDVANDEYRQAVIRELIVTEGSYINHLTAIVGVFIAAAHALQDNNLLLDVDTARLFSNIPDVLNANLEFWEIVICPMIHDAVINAHPFNTELMAPGFYRLEELFQPYEKFLVEQNKALEYLKSLSHNEDFKLYLAWCHSQKACNRLQLSDIMVKPMQRLTKYSLILQRIHSMTESESERTALAAMTTSAKTYVTHLNRSIRQKEEYEKLEELSTSIEPYEIETKDEDMERAFRLYAQLNLRAPMANCVPCHSRSVVYEGDLRFKDNIKEFETRAILLTDHLLICKKMPKNSQYQFKLARPKYAVHKMATHPKFKGTGKEPSKEIVALVCVMLDDVGSPYTVFSLTEIAKDTNLNTLRMWELKIREAKLAYNIAVRLARHPSWDLPETEIDSSSDCQQHSSGSASAPKSSEDINVEREARERVATMLHRNMGSFDYDMSQMSVTTDSLEGEMQVSSISISEYVTKMRRQMHRNSSASSRNSRLSSFQQSIGAVSQEEPSEGSAQSNYTAASTVEHIIPPLSPDHVTTHITVNVMSESETDTVVPTRNPTPSSTRDPSPQVARQMSPPPPRDPSPQALRQSPQRVSGRPLTPLVILQQPSHSNTPSSRSVSAGHNTHLHPASGAMPMVQSMPELSNNNSSPTHVVHSPSSLTASEQLYQSHQELLQRNRILAQQAQLKFGHRATAYPTNRTRGLARDDSFIYSFMQFYRDADSIYSDETDDGGKRNQRNRPITRQELNFYKQQQFSSSTESPTTSTVSEA